MMFLRFTDKPELDLENPVSYHQIDDPETVRSEHRSGRKVRFFKNSRSWAVEIDGLCGFGLDAQNLEEAIAEAQREFSNIRDVYNCVQLSWAIFEGEYSSENVPDGDAFYPHKLIYQAAPLTQGAA